VRLSPEARVLKPGAVVNLYRDVWRQLKGDRRIFVGAVVLLISAQVVLLAVPYISGRALNALQLHGTGGFRSAGLWLSMGLFVACGSWLLHGPGRILERRAAIMIRERMSALLVDRLFALPLSWHDGHHSGATAHRVQQSSQALAAFAQSQYIYLNSAVRLLGPLIALSCVQPLVGLAAVAGFSLIISSVFGFDRAMLRLANQENDAERRYAATLIDTLGNTGTVYALRQARSAAARLQQRLLAVFVPLRRAIVLNELKWLTVDLSTRVLNCCLVALFVWIATRASPSAAGASPVTTVSPSVAGKMLLLGSLYMVWEYAQQAAGVIASIASHFQTFARQHADYASADLIRSTAPAPAPAATPADLPWRRMAVRDLTFHHAWNRAEHSSGGVPARDDGKTLERPTCTLERLSFTLERGKRYALVGASGSGKSTLMRVLAGLYPAERIALKLDDGPTWVTPTEAAHRLRTCATLIPQDAEVYEGSLGENLALCESVRGPPAPTAYTAALEAACATDFVRSTPAGLDVRVSERAANWSGGQRSRIALARGILAACGSDIVLLDEPTASLDPETEARVYTNLFAAFADACVISSVHRLSLLSRFDQILVMQEGRLVGQGSLDELALTCPEFQRLSSLHGDAGVAAAAEPFPAQQHAHVA
jgi:ABC-type multidrug transport system fused ATPase/permease subunit